MSKQSALRVEKATLNSDKEKKKSANSMEIVQNLSTPELVIALCGPIGSPLNEVEEECKSILKGKGYELHTLKLSEYIVDHFDKLIQDPKYSEKYKLDYLTEIGVSTYDLKKRKIVIGNCLREKYHSTFLAENAIAHILKIREQRIGLSSKNNMSEEEISKHLTTPVRRAFIINSIKNQAEYDLLKYVYKDMFYMVGVTSSINDRMEYLRDNKMSNHEIWDLIDRETGEEVHYGQTVKDTFPQADYFINVSVKRIDKLKEKTSRFFNLIFSSNIATPSVHETAMYLAASSAWNSACLSRQVGAVLTDTHGEILSVGWNDVPKYGGGLYQNNFDPVAKKAHSLLFENHNYQDDRCFNLGYCSNDREKNTLSKLIVETLSEKGVLKGEKEVAEKVVRTSKINSLVEFSRSIHAEMHAIISGCISSGERVHGGKLFITTYPCHMCARHIILAGIKEVFYIEPYAKSLTKTLHSDSITEHEVRFESDLHKVHIRQFEGVGPTRYMQLFKMIPDSRKEKYTGEKKVFNNDPKDPIYPKNNISLAAIPFIESAITKFYEEKIK